MRLVFLAFLLGLVALIRAGLGVSWDGAYLFVSTLENQFLSSGSARWTQLIPFAATLWLSRLTDNVLLLLWTFHIAHAAFVVLAIVGAWLIVQRRAPGLFVWAAFGILLATLPAQACITCQGLAVLQVGWLILLAVLVGMPRGTGWAVLILAPFLIFYHPMALPVFLVGALAAVIYGAQNPEQRAHLWRWALVFAGLGALTIIKLWAFRNPYEDAQMSWKVMQSEFFDGVQGLPLTALVLGWLAGALVFIEPYAGKLRWLARGGAVVSLLGAFAGLVAWASQSDLWARAIDYRNWALALCLPFMALAMVDRHGEKSVFRLRLAQLLSVGFALTLLVQAQTWNGLVKQLQGALAFHSGCIEARNLAGIPHTAIGNWSVTPLSLLVQGKQVSSIAYFDESCAELDFMDGYQLAPYGARDYYAWDSGWFDKRAMQAALTKTHCTYAPTGQYPEKPAGWYPIRVITGGRSRWLVEKGVLEFQSAKQSGATWAATLETTGAPKSLNVTLNGKLIRTIPLRAGVEQTVHIDLQLNSGNNELELGAITETAGSSPGARIQIAKSSIFDYDGNVLCP